MQGNLEITFSIAENALGTSPSYRQQGTGVADSQYGILAGVRTTKHSNTSARRMPSHESLSDTIGAARVIR